jgi:hypothetical protein
MEKQVLADRKGNYHRLTEFGLQVFGVWMHWLLDSAAIFLAALQKTCYLSEGENKLNSHRK